MTIVTHSHIIVTYSQSKLREERRISLCWKQEHRTLHYRQKEKREKQPNLLKSLKQLDTIKSYELEQRRITLEEKRYALMKQKISGEYDVDPDTGEIDDSYTEDSEDGEV